MTIDVVETLQTLVAIPSVNPMGRDVSGEEYLEHRVTDFLENLFRQLGLTCERQQIEPKRDNILARLNGSRDPLDGGSLLVFEAHQDTVPVDGMTISPWLPEIRDGKLFGRGSCDIKGGMACMLTAIARLATERPSNMPTIVMACSVNEEHGYSGAVEMADLWQRGESKLVPRIPDGVIVAEPTELNVVVAHKGVVRWKCHTVGTACHSSMPESGDNAIYRMGQVIGVLKRYAEEIAPSQGEHALVGRPTLSVGTISGGISVNTVPDQCTIEIDRRVLPGEDPFEAQRQVIDYVSAALEGDSLVRHDDPYIASKGLDNILNADFAPRLAAVAAEFHCPAQLTGVPYGTDAPAFNSVGAPTVVFGPGALDQAHTCDEWIAIEQLHKAVDSYYSFAKQFAV